MKIYVLECVEKTVDGEQMKVVKTFTSKPDKFHYVMWI